METAVISDFLKRLNGDETKIRSLEGWYAIKF
jgi:hypothetical protein